MAEQPEHKVSDQIRMIVDNCGLSHAELAEQTGIDKSTLSRFMHGERGLSMKALDRLGETLGLTINMRRRKRRN